MLCVLCINGVLLDRCIGIEYGRCKYMNLFLHISASVSFVCEKIERYSPYIILFAGARAYLLLFFVL